MLRLANAFLVGCGFLLTGSLPMLFTGTAHAQRSVVTRCVNAKGHAYYPPNLLAPKEGRWAEDGIKNGEFLLLRRSSADFEIVFRDASERSSSTSDQGGRVFLMSEGGEHMVFAIVYPDNSLETWYFRIDQQGRGDVTFSQARYAEGTLIKKHSLMRATCSR